MSVVVAIERFHSTTKKRLPDCLSTQTLSDETNDETTQTPSDVFISFSTQQQEKKNNHAIMETKDLLLLLLCLFLIIVKIFSYIYYYHIIFNMKY